MPSLNVPQAQFLTLPHKFRAFVAGFGSGKTWVGCSALSKHFMEWPGVNAGYFAPTYPQIRDIFYPTMDEVAYDWGLDVGSILSSTHISNALLEYRTPPGDNEIAGQKKSREAFGSRDLFQCLAGNQGFEPWRRY